MKKQFNTRVVAEIAICAALGFALDALQGGIWRGAFPNGGSIGLAMLPIFVICYRRGLVPGVLCGLIISLTQMLGGITIIPAGKLGSPALDAVAPFLQVLGDYVLPYTLVGLAGIFAKKFQKSDNKVLWLMLGVCVGGLFKYTSHLIAGYFWVATIPGSEIFGLTDIAYDFVYNGLYCIPNIILCGILMFLIHKFAPKIFTPEAINEVKENKNEE